MPGLFDFWPDRVRRNPYLESQVRAPSGNKRSDLLLRTTQLSGTRIAVDPLTPAQARVLDAIRSRVDVGEPTPTYRELQTELGFSSSATVRDHLRVLERKGYMELGGGRVRNLRLLRDLSQAVRVPVLGTVVAGVPTLAHEAAEGFVEVPACWVRGDTYALRVSGDSMIGAGILEGDIAVLRRDVLPRDNDIVCATVDGESTLKRLDARGEVARLMPANDAYAPVQLSEDSVIQGVVQLVIRMIVNRPLAVRNHSSFPAGMDPGRTSHA